MWLIGLFIIALFTLLYFKFNLKLKNLNGNGVLPPGSMGLPFIGETLQILIHGRSIDIHPFIKKRIQKYGPIFKTNIAGRPVIVSADAKVNHFLFLQEGRLVELWYLDSLSKIFNLDGESRTNAVGVVHHYLRNLILSHFGPETIRENLLPQMKEIVSKTLNKWSRQSSIDVKRATSTMVFDITAMQLFGYDPENSSEDLSENLSSFLEVLVSFPLNIPGTKFYKCMQDRKKTMNMIRDKLREKCISGQMDQRDLLDQAIEDMNTREFLKEDFIVQLMFSLLVTSFESISAVLTLAFSLLAENPLVVEQLMNEHEAILKKRELSNSSITWEEYKSMTFTLQVIKETLRMTNNSPGFLRRAIKDFEVHGFTIPKGWTIMIASSAQQLDPTSFPDPLVFNPWRWEDIDPSVVSKNFMPFGGGMRQCAGAEFSKVFMTVFFHVLITEYRWELIKTDNISRTPLLSFGDGIHIKIFKI